MVTIAECINELQRHGTPERAAADKRYHKSPREHWGVPVPDTTRVARAFAKGLDEAEVIAFARALWETDLFDPMICALKMITLPRTGPSKPLWETVLHFLKVVDGWALEDQMAHAAWRCILADPALLDQVERWTEHENFWMRRAALVYTASTGKLENLPTLKAADLHPTRPGYY